MKITLLTCLAVTLLAGACADSAPSPPATRPSLTAIPPSPLVTIPAGGTIQVGVSAPLSGDQMALGTDVADAATMAAEEFGEIQGHRIELVARDDGCADAERAELVARGFAAEDRVVAVVGPMCTTGAQAANDVYERAGIVHISPTVTRETLSEIGDGSFFRVAWRDDAQADAQARYAREALTLPTAVVIDDGDAYGVSLADEFASGFQRRGGQVLSRERVRRGMTDFSGLAREALGLEPSLVAFEGFNPEGALVLKALRDAGYAGVFIAPDAMLSIADLLQTVGGAAEGVIVTGGATPSDDFAARFQARFGRAPGTPFVVQAYDSVTLVARAVSLAAESQDGSLTIGRESFVAAMRAQQLDGVSGRIAFDANGDRTGQTAADLGLVIYRFTGGRFERIE